MVQGRKNLRLTLETSEAVGVGEEGVGQDFQRDFTIQSGVARTIHLAHPAAPEG
jgi:hypothetical protein